MYWGLVGTIGMQKPEGIWVAYGGIWGVLGVLGHEGCQGASGDVWGVRVYWGAGRDSSYPGARRGIETIKGYWGLLGGVVDVGIIMGTLGGCQVCQGVLGVSGCVGELAGTLGTQGPEGV